jgi:SpoVK/Ycf46/Vps4 family AAA+-type ATPase
MKSPDYPFLRDVGRILNAGQSRSVLLTGNIYDLYHLDDKSEHGSYEPIVDFLTAKWNIGDLILVVYELNGAIRFVREADVKKVKKAWLRWRTGMDEDELAIKRMLETKKTAALSKGYTKDFDDHLRSAIGNPTAALEVLRQMCLCSRLTHKDKPFLRENLLVIIEAADLILPEGEIGNLSDADRHRVSICHDWLSDPGFANGDDAVVFLAESRSLIHHRVARLPQVIEVTTPSPDEEVRRHFITWFNRTRPDEAEMKLWASQKELAACTAGLSIQALMQLLKGAVHQQRKLTQQEVIEKVGDYIKSQLGEEMIEFKKPEHSLDDVIGFARLKDFLRAELIPRVASKDTDALPGAAVCGAIGSGKTFIFEAVAAELDMVVLVLKSIRSKWYGQTDVLFERLKRVLEALSKVLIFVDEADTQFGGVGPETHSTERRLTGKIQAMMSDPKLRGRVVWLLMTARIHLLSPDIRRPGRVGDLIIPILDPEGEDREAFLRWMTDPVLEDKLNPEQMEQLKERAKSYASANFSALRSELKAKAKQKGGTLSFENMLWTLDDHIPPAIADTRRYQTLQALVNCTRKSLLPDPEVSEVERRAWLEEIHALERKGVQ